MRTDDRPPFGDLLRHYREAASLTREELAERAGLSANGIAALERGERRYPYPHTVRALADALALSEEERHAFIAAVPHRRRATADPPAHDNLPAPVRPLVGRRREVAQIRQLLTTSRLVTLTGVGGTGKTRLALQVAAESKDAFPGGRIFVDLSPLDDPRLVPGTIERALDAQQAVGASPEERIARAIGDRNLLLIVDNFEHVIEASTIVSSLLATAPGLRVLATSRIPLRLYGEQEFRVPPLPLPSDPHRPEESEAVQLFLQAARAVRPDFTLTPANRETVAAICHRLDGLPLAIELAAARIRLFPPEALLARLSERHATLGTAPRDLPARQQTLRQAFDWSYALLTPEERALLAALGVFAGGFTPEAVQAVCLEDGAPTETLMGLEALHLSSLVERSDVPDGSLRFYLLETVRAYALARLRESGAMDEVRERHAHYFLGVAEAAAPALTGAGQTTWLTRLELEHDNLRAALRWAIERGELEVGLRLSGALWRFWVARGLAREGRRWFDAVLAAGPPPFDTPEGVRAYCDALIGAATVSMRLGELDAAEGLLTQCLPLARSLGNPHLVAGTLTQLGHIAVRQGRLAAARQDYQESLELSRANADPWGVAMAHAGLGDVALAESDYAAARDAFEEACHLVRAEDDQLNLHIVLCQLGYAHLELGATEAARTCFAESLSLARAHRNRRGIALALVQHGRLADRLGDIDRALFAYQESLEIYRQNGSRPGIADCLEGMAVALARGRDPEQAARLLGAAGALRAAVGRSPLQIDRAELTRAATRARAALGEATFKAVLAAGAAQPLEEIIDHPLGE